MGTQRVRTHSKIVGYWALSLNKDGKIRKLTEEVFDTKPLVIEYLKSKNQTPLIYEEIKAVHTVCVYE